ncbi:MAG: YesL family protein [Lachnospiraceae bacterium]|nr:YesL family protein [Lachnospiraceae bacterium]
MPKENKQKNRKHPMLDPESSFVSFLTLLANLMIVNLLTLFLMIPVFTAGAAFTAMASVLMAQCEGEDSSVVKRYFHSFSHSFGDATMLYLIYLALFVLQLGLVIFSLSGAFSISAPILAVFAVIDIIFFGSGVYGFALTARYKNTVTGTFVNSMKLFFGFLPMSLSITGAFVLMGLLIWKTWPYLGPVGILFGLSLPEYLSVKEILKIFDKVSNGS